MVVIADDFTGAAEIGGIALRYNLGVDIITNFENDLIFDRDINIIVTDSRSMNHQMAIEVNKIVSKKIKNIGINNVYKKIDSVFRGYVYDELIEHLNIFNKNKAIVVAGNPAIKRIIIDGKYFIDNKPLNETCFSKDPEFPIKSNIIKDIIGNSHDNFVYTGIKPMEKLPSKGIIIGDVKDIKDFQIWAEKICDDSLPSGSSGFFEYILKSKNYYGNNKIDEQLKSFGDKILLVFGSSFSKNKSFFKNIKDYNFYISDMPIDLYYQRNIKENFILWNENVIKALKQYKKVAITVSHKENLTSKEKILYIRQCIAKLIASVIKYCDIDDLLIEGGSTAAAIFKEMNISKIFPVYEYEMGTIKMKVNNYNSLMITTKPGSYKWPKFFEDIMNKKIY